MIAPYLAIAATGLPAAARSRGFLRWYLLWEVVLTCAGKAAFIHFQHWDEHEKAMVWPLYNPLWKALEPIGIILAGCAVLQACRPRWWVAVPAVFVHALAAGYPQRWPGSWLHAEIHAVAFCCLLFGLAMVAERRNADLALLFLGTAAALYPSVWAMWIRPYLMWFQAACYLWLACGPRQAPTDLRGFP